MEALKQGSDALFILLGGIMVLAMHAGFAFLELGTVRKKNQVNALVKILGELVDPEVIERELVAMSCGRLLPGTVAVIAIPDERAGSVLIPVFQSSVSTSVI